MIDTQKTTIGVVVPDLAESGGVQTIVEMLIKQIEKNPNYDYKIISLATSSADSCSTKFTKPKTWLKGVTSTEILWRNRKVLHIGCEFTEFEFMRYQSRSLLTKELASCDLVQVVCGFPAWGNSVVDLKQPMCVWAATLCAWERKSLLKNTKGLKTLWRKLMTIITTRIDDSVIENSDNILVMNSHMVNYAKKLNSKGVIYAPPGVDTKWFTPIDSRLNAAPYIIAIGRFSDTRKNPHMLLESFKLLKEKNSSPLKLILAGGTGPDENFWQNVKNSGLEDDVSFVNNPEPAQLKVLYQNALCLALSSDEEGFGMVLIEAMACGVPVVSTRCGGPDNIVNHGNDGFLTEIGDAQNFSEKLIELCFNRELNAKMGRAARLNVESKFSEYASGQVFFNTWEKLKRK